MPVFQYGACTANTFLKEIYDATISDLHTLIPRATPISKFRKGMYGLKETSVLAYDQLKEHLAPYGYAPVQLLGLWKHSTRPTKFTLCRRRLCSKYFQKLTLDISSLLSVNISSPKIGPVQLSVMTLDWHYTAVHPMSMSPSLIR
jgi:hypothetical protein